MNQQQQLFAVSRGRTCPGCGARFDPRSQYAHDRGRRFCYSSACTEREAARLHIVTRGAGRALVHLDDALVGRLVQLPNGWQAFDLTGTFLGWGARRRDAATLFYAAVRGRTQTSPTDRVRPAR